MGSLTWRFLMKRQRDGRILPVVFRSQGGRYEVTLIDHITDPYGFQRECELVAWRFCQPKPRTESSSQKWEARRPSWANLFTIGWLTYFWSMDCQRFVANPHE